MINNTALYNLANYETLHAEWDKEVNELRELCLTTSHVVLDAINACYARDVRNKMSVDYTIADNMNDRFELVHKENWVTPVINMNNVMFAKSLNPDVNHLVNAGMNGLRAYLTIPPRNDQDKLEILEYIERMQPIMTNYRKVMNDLLIEEKAIVNAI